MSDSPILNVLIGLLPLIATLIISIVVTRHHYTISVVWIALVACHALAIAIVYLINPFLTTPVHLSNALGTSLFIGLLIVVFVTLSNVKQAKEVVAQKPRPVEFRPEKIDEYVQAIEDKLKGINFVVGRVYRSSNNGTVAMRERLRIPSEWYNDFHAIPAEDRERQLGKAKTLIRKIHDRLTLLKKRENELFSQEEMAALKHIMRNKDGDDTIIHVLKTNDRDPVEHYFTSATDFCERILKELEHVKEEKMK